MEVHMMILAPGSCVMICRTAVMPSISGITMSIVTKSGLNALYLSTASSPFWASPTTSNPFLLKMPLIIIRMTTASSTMRTRLLITRSHLSLERSLDRHRPRPAFSLGNGRLCQPAVAEICQFIVNKFEDGLIFLRPQPVEAQTVRKLAGRRNRFAAHHLGEQRQRRLARAQKELHFEHLPELALAIHDERAAAAADIPDVAPPELADCAAARSEPPRSGNEHVHPDRRALLRSARQGIDARRNAEHRHAAAQADDRRGQAETAGGRFVDDRRAFAYAAADVAQHDDAGRNFLDRGRKRFTAGHGNVDERVQHRQLLFGNARTLGAGAENRSQRHGAAGSAWALSSVVQTCPIDSTRKPGAISEYESTTSWGAARSVRRLSAKRTDGEQSTIGCSPEDCASVICLVSDV